MTVKNFKKPIEVHDTFFIRYTDGADRDLVFMNSPSGVLWPSVIEKACALHYGSYPAMSDYKKLKANDFWELLLGSPPQGGFKVEDSTDIEMIRDAARAAPRVPTIAASRMPVPSGAPVTQWHAHAVLGMTGKNIDLYDPAKAKIISIEFEEFRRDFQTVLFGNSP